MIDFYNLDNLFDSHLCNKNNFYMSLQLFIATGLCFYLDQHGIEKKINGSCPVELGPKVIKQFPCSTQLSMKFQPLIKTKILKEKLFLLSNSQMLCS